MRVYVTLVWFLEKHQFFYSCFWYLCLNAYLVQFNLTPNFWSTVINSCSWKLEAVSIVQLMQRLMIVNFTATVWKVHREMNWCVGHTGPLIKHSLHVTLVLCSAFPSAQNHSPQPANRPWVVTFPLAAAYSAATILPSGDANVMTLIIIMCSWCWEHTRQCRRPRFISLPAVKQIKKQLRRRLWMPSLPPRRSVNINGSWPGNGRPGPTSELESISEENDLFRSPIIIPSLKTLRLMPGRLYSISASPLSRTNSPLWNSTRVHVYTLWSPSGCTMGTSTIAAMKMFTPASFLSR